MEIIYAISQIYNTFGYPFIRIFFCNMTRNMLKYYHFRRRLSVDVQRVVLLKLYIFLFQLLNKT